jgi:hypothetical protein
VTVSRERHLGLLYCSTLVESCLVTYSLHSKDEGHSVHSWLAEPEQIVWTESEVSILSAGESENSAESRIKGNRLPIAMARMPCGELTAVFVHSQ